jgi:hypothetical protein
MLSEKHRSNAWLWISTIRHLESKRIPLVDELATLVHGKAAPGSTPLSQDEKEARIKELTDALKSINDQIWTIRSTP